MARVNDFVRLNLNKPIDFDGSYGAECVDLFREYCKFLNFSKTESVGGASELFTGYESRLLLMNQFKRYPMSSIMQGDFPRVGDCIIWDKAPTYGHVGVCLSADEDILLVFEQMGYSKDDTIKNVSERNKFLSPAEMKLNQAHVWAYPGYAGVLGWLRPKGVWIS